MQRLFILIFLLLAYSANAQTGNVGIGTTSPSEKLHVAGNIKADTLKPNAFKLTYDAAAGKVLTSDAAGNGSWQAAATTNTNTPSGNVGYGGWGDCATNATLANYQPLTDPYGTKSAYFGSKTFLSGNNAITGARYEAVGTNSYQGTATILQNNGNRWVPVQKLTDANGQANDNFGSSVSINDSFAIIGAQAAKVGSNASQGAVIVFKRTGSAWVQVQRIIDSSGHSSEGFGSSVYLSGNTLVIGAFTKNISSTAQGAVFVYQYNGNAWISKQMLSDPTGTANNLLGRSVSVSGNTIVAGAPGWSASTTTSQGAACIFTNNGGTWTFTQRINEAYGVTNDNFGVSVSISDNNLLVGVPGYDYQFNTLNTDQGAVCFYHFDGTFWVLQQKLSDYLQGATDDHLGFSVCLSGNYAMATAYGADLINVQNVGATYLYVNTGNAWQKLQRITEPAATTSDYTGIDVFLDITTRNFAIGSINFNYSMGKVIFGKIN